MSDLANYCREADADSLGEFLRGITFPGEGLGCYSTFDVREGAEKFDRPRLIQWWDVRGLEDPTFCAEMGQGWTFPFDNLTVDAAWFWDGDGYLTFGVFGPNLQRFVANDDCKKDYCWEDDLA